VFHFFAQKPRLLHGNKLLIKISLKNQFLKAKKAWLLFKRKQQRTVR